MVKSLDDFPEWQRIMDAGKKLEDVAKQVPDFANRFGAATGDAVARNDDQALVSFVAEVEGNGIPLTEILDESEAAQRAFFAMDGVVPALAEALHRHKGTPRYEVIRQYCEMLSQILPDEDVTKCTLQAELMADAQ